jgi:hypothetical protein
MNKRTILIGTVIALLMILSNGIQVTHAERITIEKPFMPVEISEGIPLSTQYRTEPLEILCRLEEGKKYHIFLVGDWITNQTEDATDYDIEVYDSQNNFISGHTESAGLPEQVANEKSHQYFVPSKTDTYRFDIYNDPLDSKGSDPAVFMIIEHIEMNKRYEVYLEGRPSPTGSYPPNYLWAYEFSTPNDNYQLHVDVPDPDIEKGIKGLDMYEARVFPMANPSAEVGYNIWGLGVPTGETLLGEVDGQYGLYNTSIPGESFQDWRASCEYAGEDMDVVFGKALHNETELVLDTKDVFYYMVMLAEYYEGTISFYIKTDYRQVNVSIIESPEIGVTSEEHRIVADIQGPADISSAWINYTTDGWQTEKKIPLTEVDGLFECWLPKFELLDNVQYKIYAEDEIANSGSKESEFLVLDPVHLHIETNLLKIYGGESIEISGEALEFSKLTLIIEHIDNTENVDISVDGEGLWSHNFKPAIEGYYSARVSFEGDDTHPTAESREITFSMEKQKPLISHVINPTPAKKTRDLEVSGKLTPPLSGVTIKMICATQTSSFELETTTLNDGSFNFNMVPEELGTWQVLPQIPESNFVKTVQGELKVFNVIELTTLEKVTIALLRFTVMPLVLAPVGLAAAGFGYGEMKTGFIRGLIKKATKKGESTEAETVEEKNKGKKPEANGGVTSYRRRSDR